MQISSLAAAAAAFVLAVMPLASPAAAAVTYFGFSRAAFEAAAGSTVTETFNGFPADTSFQTLPLDVGPFGLSMSNTQFDGDGDNQVQVAPFPMPGTPDDYDVNGTPFAQVNLNNFTSALPATFTITFDAPTFAFGADLYSFNNTDSLIMVMPGVTAINLPAGSTGTSFLGLVSDTSFLSVELRRTDTFGNERFGLDNVTFSAAPVPEPATWTMMLAGFGLLGATMRRGVTKVQAVV